MFQGTLESNIGEGAAVVAAYNALGYTAAAVGNHEFDFGPVGKAATPRTPADDPRGALKARAAEARFPFLAANLIDVATGAPPQWPNVQPTALVDAAGLKVGIVGVMTLRALSATIAGNVGDLRVTPLAESVRTHATALRAKGAHVIVVAAHAGGRCTAFDRAEDLSSCDPDAEILAVARALPRGLVDVIVAGHTHAAMAHQIEDIAVIEAYSSGRAFGRVDVTIDPRTRAVLDRRHFPPRDLCEREDPATKACGPASNAALAPVLYEGAAVQPDPAIERLLEPALTEVRTLKAQPLGVTLPAPIRRLQPVSPLGNLVTDALLASVPGADIAVNNSGGGLRADLPAGALTYGGVFEVMPFDNLLVTLRLTGRQLRQMFSASVTQGRRGLGFAGIQVQARCEAGALAVAMTRPSGAAIGDDDANRARHQRLPGDRRGRHPRTDHAALADRPVRELMTPRNEIDTIDRRASEDDVRAMLKSSPHSLWPVVDGAPDAVCGVVKVLDLQRALLAGKKIQVARLMRKAEILPDQLDAMDALKLLQQSDVSMAMVHDEYGHLEGIVTPADLLSAIVGHFASHQDEGDEPMIVMREDGSLLLSGALPVDALGARLGIDISEDRDYATAAGFVLSVMKRLPREGEHFNEQGWRIEIVDMDGRRIDKLLASKIAVAPAAN